MELETPRDRNGEFEPQIVKKNQTRWTGFDDKILSLYSRGMTTRQIQGHLEEMYQVEVSPSLISDVTEGVIEQARSMAEPAAGAVLRGGFSGRAVREDAARGTGGKPSRVCSGGHQSGRAERCFGTVDARPTKAPSSG